MVTDAAGIVVECAPHVDEVQWQSALSAMPDATVQQTTQWAAFMGEYTGARPLFCTARSEDEIVGTALFLGQGRHFELVFERPFGQPLAAMLRRWMPRWSTQQAPVTRPDVDAAVVTRAMVRAAETSTTGPIAFTQRGTGRDDVCDVLRSEGYEERLLETIVVDLTPEEEKLWSSLKGAARKAVRRAERDGIEVHLADSREEVAEFHQLCVVARAGMGLRTFSVENFHVMWDHLREAGLVHFFLATHQQRLIAGLGIWRFGDHIMEFAAAQADVARSEKLFGSDAIKWKIIQWGHEQGCRHYDLAGVNSTAEKGSKEANVFQFKNKWGGSLGRVAEYSKGSR